MFRNLKANEIECRVSQIKTVWVTLLLYKDARCDMNILDETVGQYGWQREHQRDNANCIVSIWDKEKEQWISKEDTGTQSFTEKEKGLASDSFKRACFNWGIGRELYTSPFIKITPNKENEFFEKNGKFKTWSKFKVSEVEYIDNVISYLEVTDQNGSVRFKSGLPTFITKEQTIQFEEYKLSNDQIAKWLKYFKVEEVEHITQKQAVFMFEKLGEK